MSDFAIRECRSEEVGAVLELWRQADATPGVTDTTDQVPFLVNSKAWQANVSLPGTNDRSPRAVRLLQVDVAVRDDRADATTG